MSCMTLLSAVFFSPAFTSDVLAPVLLLTFACSSGCFDPSVWVLPRCRTGRFGSVSLAEPAFSFPSGVGGVVFGPGVGLGAVSEGAASGAFDWGACGGADGAEFSGI